MAGFEPSGVICEVMNDDGTMARRAELEAAAEHNLKIGTIADLIHYRMIHERTVQRIAEQPLDSELGQFNLVTYRDSVEGDVHMALTLGKICAEEPTLVRVHNMDPLRDLLMVKQPGRWSLRAAMAAVAEAGSGVVLLLGTRWMATCCWRISAKPPSTRSKRRPPTASSVPVRRSCATSVCAKCA
jgi:3,4-dihydroxy 2-butanone 4-phosphate synthase/GTP cyclohydrolase II